MSMSLACHITSTLICLTDSPFGKYRKEAHFPHNSPQCVWIIYSPTDLAWKDKVMRAKWEERSQAKAGDVAQWLSVCLAHTRPWIQFPVTYTHTHTHTHTKGFSGQIPKSSSAKIIHDLKLVKSVAPENFKRKELSLIGKSPRVL
jgi:hypothetical protein